MIEAIRETGGNILALWVMLIVIPIGPGLGTALARHYHWNEVFWAFVGMPLGLSLLLIGSGVTVVRMNQG